MLPQMNLYRMALVFPYPARSVSTSIFSPSGELSSFFPIPREAFLQAFSRLRGSCPRFSLSRATLYLDSKKYTCLARNNLTSRPQSVGHGSRLAPSAFSRLRFCCGVKNRALRILPPASSAPGGAGARTACAKRFFSPSLLLRREKSGAAHSPARFIRPRRRGRSNLDVPYIYSVSLSCVFQYPCRSVPPPPARSVSRFEEICLPRAE